MPYDFTDPNWFPVLNERARCGSTPCDAPHGAVCSLTSTRGARVRKPLGGAELYVGVAVTGSAPCTVPGCAATTVTLPRLQFDTFNLHGPCLYATIAKAGSDPSLENPAVLLPLEVRRGTPGYFQRRGALAIESTRAAVYVTDREMTRYERGPRIVLAVRSRRFAVSDGQCTFSQCELPVQSPPLPRNGDDHDLLHLRFSNPQSRLHRLAGRLVMLIRGDDPTNSQQDEHQCTAVDPAAENTRQVRERCIAALAMLAGHYGANHRLGRGYQDTLHLLLDGTLASSDVYLNELRNTLHDAGIAIPSSLQRTPVV